MAYKVLLSIPAAQDRESIADYLFFSLSAPSAARDFLEEFDRVVNQVAENPRSCELSRDVALSAKGMRKALVGSYIFIYTIDDRDMTVYILRVFHQSQDYASLI